MSDKTTPRIHYEEDYYYININVSKPIPIPIPIPIPKPNDIIIKNDNQGTV